MTVPGASVPYPYGGTQRQVMVDLDWCRLQSKALSPADVVTALGQQSTVLPSGTAKIGELEHDVAMNASARTVAELNDEKPPSENDDDLPNLGVRFEIAMSFDDLLKWECFCNIRLKCT